MPAAKKRTIKGETWTLYAEFNMDKFAKENMENAKQRFLAKGYRVKFDRNRMYIIYPKPKGG